MIYLDHHAATPLLPEVISAMDEARADAWANPSSVHAKGRASRAHLERARRDIAHALCVEAADIVLTSGGSEALSLALFGLLSHVHGEIVTTATEHPATENALNRVASTNTRIIRLEVPNGVPPTPDAFAAALSKDTKAIAIQWVNHEVGTLFPIEAYAAIAAERNIPVILDATQALGRVPIDLEKLKVTGAAFAAQKIGGPTGAGALFIKRGVDIEPLLAGGAQERGRRPGTPDVMSAVGFGAACRALPSRLLAMSEVASLRDQLEAGLVARGAVVNGGDGPRVASTTNVSFEGRRGAVLVSALDLEGVCASSGAACSSGLAAPSPIVQAMYPNESWRAFGALRLSLGPETLNEDVRGALAAMDRVLARNA